MTGAMSPEVLSALEVLRKAFGGAMPMQVTAGPTVRELWAKYEASESTQIKSWQRSQECGRQILSAFGDRVATSITMCDIDEWRVQERKRITNRGKPTSPATRNRTLIVLRRLLNWAFDRQLIDRNPLHRLKMERENNLRETVLTDADVEKLMVACGGRSMLRVLILVLFDTGCRKSEVLNLRWEQIDAANSCLRLGSKDTKNKRPRRPPLTKRALAALLACPRRHPDSPYVFCNSSTGRPLSPRNLFRDLELVVARSGVKGANGENIGWHCLRHAFIAKARKLRMPERLVMAQTGHLTRCAFDRYGGSADDGELAELVDIMQTGTPARRGES